LKSSPLNFAKELLVPPFSLGYEWNCSFPPLSPHMISPYSLPFVPIVLNLRRLYYWARWKVVVLFSLGF